MRIIFHSNQLSERGTEVALYDYAHHNEILLGNESIILFRDPSVHPYSDWESMNRFSSRFKCITYKNLRDIDEIIVSENIDIFYAIKSGNRDGVVSNKVKTCIHTVFQNYQPHGDVYAYVSKWLSNRMTDGEASYVPHMIDLPDVKDDLRRKLGIPVTSRVYGRYGGFDTFDIEFVRHLIREIVTDNIFFLFMNTRKFTDQKNVIFLDKTCDAKEKVKFINSCDAMLHARKQGESFGLACGEFSIKNKPVITSSVCYDRCHLDILGDKGIYYANKDKLRLILENDIEEKNWDAYSKNFNSQAVMRKFEKVFLG